MNKLKYLALILLLLLLSCRLVNPVMIHFENDKPSVSIGESWEGKLINGKRLPSSGENFVGASHLLMALGRNAVHSELRKTVLASFDSLYALNPEWEYRYGECAWVNGGKIWPHYTHQNGLVIDFMVPVILAKDSTASVIPTHVFNRFGYSMEFDTTGKSGKYLIDFESLAAHLYFLKTCGPAYGIHIRRIIFAPEFLPQLYATKYGNELRDIEFVYKEHWVRHDDHYHIEFTYEATG